MQILLQCVLDSIFPEIIELLKNVSLMLWIDTIDVTVVLGDDLFIFLRSIPFGSLSIKSADFVIKTFECLLKRGTDRNVNVLIAISFIWNGHFRNFFEIIFKNIFKIWVIWIRRTYQELSLVVFNEFFSQNFSLKCIFISYWQCWRTKR